LDLSTVRCLTGRVLDPHPIAAPESEISGDRPASDRVPLDHAAGRGGPPPSRVGDPTDEPIGASRTARTTRLPGLLEIRIGRDIRVAGVRSTRSNDPIDPGIHVRHIATGP
jgi:hypothetical protein